MKSLDAVIRGFENCTSLECKVCPYNNHNFPADYISGNCDSEDKDNDALHYLKEYQERQKGLEKEFAYWKKQNEIICDLVPLLEEHAKKEIVHCKDCGYYAENYSAGGVIVAHHVCMKWGRGCITDPDGFCHYALKRGDYELTA